MTFWACAAGSGCSVSKELLSVVVGITVFFFLDAKIQDAKWLTAAEKSALTSAIGQEDAQHTKADGGKVNRWKMLLNPQILLLCGIYFSVQLSIYANTFWLPSIVKQIPGTTDLSVGFLSSIPWVCAVFAMYFAAKWQDKAKSKRPLLVAALLVAAVGTFAAAIASPVFALVFLAIAAMGFKSASPLFWTIPQSALHPLVLAPAIAIINSLGNLGGFVAPFGFGIIKEQTGSVVPGLFALAAASTLAAGLVYFLKERKGPATGVAAERRDEVETSSESADPTGRRRVKVAPGQPSGSDTALPASCPVRRQPTPWGQKHSTPQSRTHPTPRSRSAREAA